MQQPSLTVMTPSGNPAIYLFKNGDGFLMVSADDMAAPVLGYSDNNSFDADNIPPQMEWWLEEYSRQIEALAATASILHANSYDATEKEAIGPLLKSKWNQDAPYNNECPVFEGKRSMTGCVATSMAQLMYYFKYPAIGMGSVKYTTDTYKKELEMDFSEHPFDWDAMQDSYSGNTPEEDGAAVAFLMKSCGYSTFMNYTPNESSATSYLIVPALINNFQYDKGLYYANRNTYTAREWEDLIYENIKNVGPVIYNGTSSLAGGHSFVCDGYDGNGFFHINWGWGGTSDGYFLLDALNPGALGIGGGSGGFNFSQGAVIGARPPMSGSTSHPANLTQMGTLNATYTDNKLTFSLSGGISNVWVNKGYSAFRFSMGAIFEPLDGTPGETFTNICNLVGSSTSATLDPTYYYNSLRPSTSTKGMKDGKYKVTLATKDLAVDNAPWIPVLCDSRYNNYVYVTKSGSEYTVEIPATRVLKVASVNLESELYLGCMAKIGITVTNDSEEELTQGFAPLIVYGGRNIMVGESMIIRVPAGQTVSESIYTNLYAMTTSMPSNNSKVILRFYNPEDGLDAVYREAQQEVTLKKNPGKPVISASMIDPDIAPDDAGVYHLSCDDELRYGINIKVVSGYFAYPLYAIVSDSEGSILVQKRIGDNLQFIESGQSAIADVAVAYPQFSEGDIYETYVAYSRDNKLTKIGSSYKFTLEKNGMAPVGSDNGDIEAIFDPVSNAIHISPVSGKYHTSIYDAAGRLIHLTTSGFISCEGFAPGLKIVIVSDDRANYTVKKIFVTP